MNLKMNLIFIIMTNFLRLKEKLGFKLSEKEDMLLLVDDANKIVSMILRVKRVERKQAELKKQLQIPDVEHDEYIKMSPVSENKAKIRFEKKVEEDVMFR